MTVGTPKTSPARLEAQKKYDKNHRDNYVCLQLKMNKHTESDIINHIKGKKNRQGYIKNLILADMHREESN